MNLEHELRKIVSSVLNINETELDQLTYGESHNWDSMKHFLLVVSLEERFNIEISDDESNKLRNLEEIKIYLDRKLN